MYNFLVTPEISMTKYAAEGFNAVPSLLLPCSILTIAQKLRSEVNLNMIKLRDADLGPQNTVATANTSRNCDIRCKKLQQLVSYVLFFCQS